MAGSGARDAARAQRDPRQGLHGRNVELIEHRLLLHDNIVEWHDPQGSSMPILRRDILTAAGRTPAEIAQIESELEEEALADQLLA